MMLQTKCKYFNKRIKMVLLLLILMWSLMGQHVYGKSSTYDVGIVQNAAAHIVVETETVAADDDDDDDGDGDGYDTNVTGDMIQQTTRTKMTTTTATAMTTPTSVVFTSMNDDAKQKTSTSTTENKGKNNNATIYGHINENDNNSNKLPQNVAKRDQQQSNKMNMNMKMPPSLTLLSPSSSPVTETAITAAIAVVTPLPPTESLLMAKDQLYETAAYKIPKSIEEDKAKNETTNTKTEEEEEKQHIEIDISVANATEVYNATLADDEVNNNYPNGTINMSSNGNDFNTSTSETKYNETSSLDNNIADDNEFQIKNASYLKKSFSMAFMQQDLISQFALRFKKIPRVTYFTCMTSDKNENQKNKTENPYYQRHASIDRSTLELIKQMHQHFTKKSPNLMLKIVYIDHLLNKNRMSTSNAVTRGGFNKGSLFGFGSSGGQATRNTFTNANWLEQILRPELFRQIVVLNLACGESSRRVLEMASNKAFFNSMYHWLLLEDYVFNRQTEIDDADDIENKMNSYSSISASKSSMEEIVNGSNDAAMQVKKLSTTTYPSISDVVGASTSGSGKLNKVTLPIPAAAASPPQSSNISTIGNRQQQRLIDEKSTFTSTSASSSFSSSSNATRTEVTDENDTEIIEKFLEKLNININTELILAKRSKRGTPTSPASSVTKSSNMMPPPPSPSPPSQLNSASTTESNNYNTLQKMDYYLLYDVWNPGLQYGGEVNISSIGHYDVAEGLQLAEWFRTSSTVKRRMNMHLANVRCLVVITHKNRSDTLEEYLTTHYDTHLDSMNRFNFALLSHVRDLFNFSFILSKTATWGYLKNGKFDGMIGALVRKQADIGGSPIFFRIERAKVIDYTTRTWVARPCFIFRHPRSTKKDRIVFLQPFTNDVWVFLAICGCITIVLLWILTSIERQFDPEGCDETFGNDDEKDDSLLTDVNLNVGGFKNWFLRWGGLFCGQSLDKSKSRRRMGLFFESLLFYLGSICQQGLSFSTRLFSGRCIVITSVLFAFSIYQFYSASIVGTLLMEKPKTIRTLRDLIHSSLEIGIEDIVYNRDYFLRTKDPDAQELYAKKVTSVPMTGDTGFVDAPPDNFAIPTQLTELTDAQKAKAYRDILHSHETGAHAKTNEASNWYDPEFGVAKIKKGRFAFHVDVATAYKIIADTFSEKEICDLTEIQLFPPQKMVSIVQKGSPLRKIITYGLRRVTEVGLTDYQRKVWHSPKPRCVKQLHTDDLRVDMQTFTSALLVLIFGYAVSLLILSLEIVHFKLWQRYTTS